MSNTIKGIFFILLIALVFINCDGRNSTKNALNESIEQFKTKYQIEKAYYIPKAYTETQVDTLLQNGINVKILTATNMSTNVKVSNRKNDVTYNTFYRDVESEVLVWFDNTLIFEKSINKAFIYTHNNSFEKELKNTILKGVWIDALKSSTGSKLYLDIQFCPVNTENCHTFNLVISKDVTYQLNSLKDYTL